MIHQLFLSVTVSIFVGTSTASAVVKLIIIDQNTLYRRTITNYSLKCGIEIVAVVVSVE